MHHSQLCLSCQCIASVQLGRRKKLRPDHGVVKAVHHWMSRLKASLSDVVMEVCCQSAEIKHPTKKGVTSELQKLQLQKEQKEQAWARVQFSLELKLRQISFPLWKGTRHLEPARPVRAFLAESL